MKPTKPRTWWLIAVGSMLLLCVLIFPRVLAFVELASRELRYFWWLILLLALGIWLAFFFGKNAVEREHHATSGATLILPNFAAPQKSSWRLNPPPRLSRSDSVE